MSGTGQRVSGKVAIVTGAALGMGAAHARMLSAEGARVVVTDVRVEEGEALARELGENAIFIRLDVTSEADWARAVAAAEDAFGPVTVLVNNAGIVEMAPIDELTLSAYHRIIAINQIGPFLGMKAVIPSMRKAKSGSIINISSVAGMAPLQHLAGYVSTKFALRGLSRTASLDLADDNIRVNSVHPGTIDTPMNAGGGQPKAQAIKRMGRPEEVASMVLYLASDESSFCTGGEFVVDGGFLNVVGEIVI